MKSLKTLKMDLQVNKELHEIITVLKGIAGSDLQHLQSRRVQFEQFIDALRETFEYIDFTGVDHPCLKLDESLPKGIMIVTTNEGFVGKLNNQIVSAAFKEKTKDNDEFIVIGEKGARFLEDTGQKYIFFPGIGDIIEPRRAFGITNYIFNAFMKCRWGKIVYVYPKFISLTHQQTVLEQLLPFAHPKEIIMQSGAKRADWLIEPDLKNVVDYMMRAWVGNLLYDSFWNAKLSELSARVFHLEHSTQELETSRKEIFHHYFRTVHELRDKSIREITASRLVE